MCGLSLVIGPNTCDWLLTLYKVFPVQRVGLLVQRDDYGYRSEDDLGGRESQYGSPLGCFYTYTMHSIGQGVPAEMALAEQD